MFEVMNIDTEEARRLDYIFCAEYGCINVVPDDETADRQGWGRDQYYYEGRRRRCPGPHVYAWNDPDNGDKDLDYDIVGITFDFQDVLTAMVIFSVIVAVVVIVASH